MKRIIIPIILCISLLVLIPKEKQKLEIEKTNKIENSIAMYQSSDGTNYTEINKMPESGYKINESKSYCTIDNKTHTNAILKTIDGDHTIAGLSKEDKCYLYFDIAGQTASTILAGLTKSTRPNFNTLTTDPGNTVYSLPDDDGTSYYYAGAAKNNYVKFADKYWRIVRFNGDESIRLIYQGTSATSTGTNSQIGTSAFNSSNSNNMYVGYKYTSGYVHGTENNSTIKGVLDNWYTSNLTSYASKIDTNVGFCNDRESSTANTSSNGSGGTGTTQTYYGGYIRFVTGGGWQSNPTPTFKCKNISTDYFTVSGSNKGNKALQYPIGLITADEVVTAGANGTAGNSSFYLYTGQPYWTITPSNFEYSNAIEFYVNTNGSLSGTNVGSTRGVRPVINLRADTLFQEGGTGTADNPYVVS